VGEYVIRRCTRSEYQQFLDMAYAAFGYEKDHFQTQMSHCTPCPDRALDSEIARHLIALNARNEVVGAVGAYPRDWVIQKDGAKRAVRAFGVGQVCCRAEERGNGIMTSLVSRAIQDANERGSMLGFLDGDRFRYRRFGFEWGQEEIVFTLRHRRLGKLTNTDGLEVRTVGESDIHTVNRIYEELPSYLVRDERLWRTHLSREKYRWLLGRFHGKPAYLCSIDDDVLEIGGDPETAVRLVLHLGKDVDIRRPRCVDALSETLRQYASTYCTLPLGMMANAPPGSLLWYSYVDGV